MAEGRAGYRSKAVEMPFGPEIHRAATLRGRIRLLRKSRFSFELSWPTFP